MGNIIKPKEKEVFSDGTRKIFSMVRNGESFQNFEASLTFSTGEMTKELLNCKKRAELGRDKALIESRCLTRLL